MADLSTISSTDPTDAEAANQGASRIRETRDATKTSFGLGNGSGTQLAEHFLKGMHKFPNGDGTFPGLPGVPAAGNLGRIFIDTTNGRVLEDNGAAWVLLRTVPRAVGYTAGTISGGTVGAWISIATTATLNVPAGGRVIVLAGASIAVAPADSFIMRIVVDAAAFTLEPGVTNAITTPGLTAELWPMMFAVDISSVVTAGDHTFSLQQTCVGAVAYQFQRRLIIAAVL